MKIVRSYSKPVVQNWNGATELSASYSYNVPASLCTDTYHRNFQYAQLPPNSKVVAALGVCAVSQCAFLLENVDSVCVMLRLTHSNPSPPHANEKMENVLSRIPVLCGRHNLNAQELCM